MWGAEIISHEGTHYVIKGSEYNSDIAANGSFTAGFSATSSTTETVLENVVVTSMR